MRVVILTIAISLIFCNGSFAGGVVDNNNGAIGDILVSTGNNNGANSVGTWTDPSFLKGDKGDKGDTGEQGIAGTNGIDGLNGQDGYTPVKGTDYNDGNNGVNGIDGSNGIDGKNGLNGTDGKEGKQGEKGATGAVGKGLNDQYKAGVECVIAETQKTSWRLYYNRDFNNQVNEAGVKVVIYIGKSYNQKQIEGLQKQLKTLADKVEGRI
jgi:hypothetical protein